MRLSRLLLLLLLLVPALARADGPSMSLRAFMPETPLTQLAQLQPPSMLSSAPVPGSVNPHVWYFSNQGNDSASCHTIASACQTIAKHNSVTFGPNDQVFWNGNDATCTGSISATTLTVTNCASGTIHLKDPLFWTNQPITSRPTQVLSQTSGTTGGAGGYTVSVSQTLASTTIIFGQTFAAGAGSGGTPVGLGQGNQSGDAGQDANLQTIMGRGVTYQLSYIDETYTPNGSTSDPSYTWAGQGSYDASQQTPGTIPVYGWGFGYTGGQGTSGTNVNLFTQIASGTYDSLIQGNLAAWKSAGFPTMVIRPAWEMNGGYYPWSTTSANLGAFQSAWQHFYSVVHTYAAANGMNINVSFCPNVGPNQGDTSVTIAQLAPNPAYIDSYCIDDYGDLAGSQYTNAQTVDNTGLQWLPTTMVSYGQANGKPISGGEIGGSAAEYAQTFVALLSTAGTPVVDYFIWWNDDIAPGTQWTSPANGLGVTGSGGVATGTTPGTFAGYWAAGFGANGTVKNGVSTSACPVINSTNLPTSGGSFSEQSYGGGNAAILSSAGCAGTNSGSQGPRKPLLNIDSVSGVTWNGVLLFANGTATQFGAQVSNSHNINIELSALIGFNTTATGDSSAEIQIQGDLDGANSGLTISDNFLGGANGAISPDDCGICSIGNGLNNTNLMISGNYIIDMGTVAGHPPPEGEGITLTGVLGAMVQYNRVTAIGANSTTCGGSSGIETYDATNVTVFHNEVDHVTIKSGCDGDGIDFDGDSHNNVAWGNFVHDNYGPGLYAWVGPGNAGTTWGPNYYYNNICQNSGSATDSNSACVMAAGPGATSPPSTIYVIGNTIYEAQPSPQNVSAMAFEVNCCGTSNNLTGLVANNIIGASASPFSFNTFLAFGTNTEPNLKFVSNDYDAISPATFLIYQYGGNNYQSLAAWQAAVPGGEAGGLSVNPVYAGTPPSTGCNFLGGSPGPAPCPNQYELAAGSPVAGAGINPAAAPYSLPNVPATDYYGNAQGGSVGYSMGAFNGVPSATVTSVTTSPATGLMTGTAGVGAGKTMTVTVAFGPPNMAVTGTPTITLNQPSGPTVCPFASVSGHNVNFLCTIGAGQDTPLSNSSANRNPYGKYLGTASVGAISLPGGATITAGGVAATLGGANNVPFPGLSAYTEAAYFVSPTGSGSTCSWASPCGPGAIQAKFQGGSTKVAYFLGGTYAFSGLPSCSDAVFNSSTNLGTFCLSASDNGESWLTYPGNINGTEAILDGGGATDVVAFGIQGASNVNIDGLVIQNFAGGVTAGNGLVNFNFTNNLVQNIRASFYGSVDQADSSFEGWTFFTGGINGVYVGFNVGLNSTGRGFAGLVAFGSPGATGNGIIIDNNIGTTAGNTTVSELADTGMVTFGDGIQSCNVNPGVLCQITNNVFGNCAVTDGRSNNDGNCFYMDNQTSGVLIQGNIAWGIAANITLLHGGSNNTFKNNVFDISGGNPGSGTGPNLMLDQSLGVFPNDSGAGNTIQNNIVYSTDTAPSTLSICYNNPTITPFYPPTQGNNLYSKSFPWYGANQDCTWNDASPNIGNPLFANPTAHTAAGYQVGAGSPAFSIPGGWTQIVQTQGRH